MNKKMSIEEVEKRVAELPADELAALDAKVVELREKAIIFIMELARLSADLSVQTGGDRRVNSLAAHVASIVTGELSARILIESDDEQIVEWAKKWAIEIASRIGMPC